MLDVGCGRGELAQLAKTLGAASYCGLDISNSALVAARELNPGIQFAQHDARKPFPSQLAAVDVIALFDVIEHVACPDELQVVMNNVVSRLALGGVIIGRTCNADSPFVAMHRYNDETHKFAFRTPLVQAIFLRHGLKVRFVDEDFRAVRLRERLLLPLKLACVFALKPLIRLLTGERVESLHPSIYFVATRERMPG